MSERSDADVERLVEAQARGEQPSGVNAEGAAGQGAELDTRRSKSAFGFSAIGAADTVVDVGGAEVDTDQYIMQQGGPAIQHGMAGGPMNLSAGGGIVPTMYPDQVDDPAWIDAHGRGAGLEAAWAWPLARARWRSTTSRPARRLARATSTSSLMQWTTRSTSELKPRRAPRASAWRRRRRRTKPEHALTLTARAAGLVDSLAALFCVWCDGHHT
jgi:hypothetical protein